MTSTPSLAPVRARLRTMPPWLRTLLAVTLVVAGALLLTRPTSSLGVLALLVGGGMILHGALTLTDGTWTPHRRSRRAARVAEAALWIVAGGFVLAYQGLTVGLLVIVIAVGLLVHGVRGLAESFRTADGLDARIARGALGLASLGLGVLALVWPDVTLLVAAVAFGARLMLAGVTTLAGDLRARRVTRPERRGSRRAHLRRFGRTATAAVALLLVAAAGVVSVGMHRASPVVDDFYLAPRDVPAAPGMLVRAEPFTRDVPANATGWRILYTTTRGDGTAAVASGLVVVPTAGAGRWPVIGWQHGTTGFAPRCAPSLLDDPFEAGALFVLQDVIDHGWALVATDYIGLGTQGPHPYLIGPDSAHASLDALRAAQQLDDARLGTQTVLWGHSQGGGASLWAGAVAEDYAPELPITGVAALAPATDLPSLVDQLTAVRGGSVFASYAVAAYTATYPDVTWREYIRPGVQQTLRTMSERCLAEPGMLVSVLSALSLSRDPEIFRTDPLSGALGARLRQNVPPATGRIPVLLAQGAADPLITPQAQRTYVDDARALGARIDYREYDGRDHVELVAADSPLMPDLFAWTEQMLDER